MARARTKRRIHRRCRRQHGRLLVSSRAVNPRARIVAIEPVSRIYERLTANIALNHFNIRALQIAASDADGEAILFDTEGESGYSASLEASMLEGYETIRVPVRGACLDSVFAELGWPRVDLLKIDVEKHEPAVLAGMQRHLAKDRPTLLIEILTAKSAPQSRNPLMEMAIATSLLEQRGLIETQRSMASASEIIYCALRSVGDRSATLS